MNRGDRCSGGRKNGRTGENYTPPFPRHRSPPVSGVGAGTKAPRGNFACGKVRGAPLEYLNGKGCQPVPKWHSRLSPNSPLRFPVETTKLDVKSARRRCSFVPIACRRKVSTFFFRKSSRLLVFFRWERDPPLDGRIINALPAYRLGTVRFSSSFSTTSEFRYGGCFKNCALVFKRVFKPHRKMYEGNRWKFRGTRDTRRGLFLFQLNPDIFKLWLLFRSDDSGRFESTDPYAFVFAFPI